MTSSPMLSRILNIAKSVADPAKRSIVLGKAVRKITDRPDAAVKEANMAWIKSHCQDFATYANEVDPALWQEAEAVSARLRERGKQTLAEAGVKMGGGGFYPMLYFLTRHRRPTTILETGVAAGYSSQVFLEGLDRNGHGRLYSSDFPYIRIENPEKYIGILVEERLKSRWQLSIKGDQVNLPLILAESGSIDLFHYDSDKSAAGRAFAFARVIPQMSPGGLVVMDDIQDDTFFRETVETGKVGDFSIYFFEGKYIGMYEIAA